MAAQTWTTLQNSLLVMLSQSPSPYTVIPADFAVLFPQATSYAEERIYDELVPLNQRTQNTSLVTTAGSRTVDLSQASQVLVTVETFSLIYPAGATIASQAPLTPLPPPVAQPGSNAPVVGGTRIPFESAGLDLIDVIWPQESVTLDPSLADNIGRYWALLDDKTLVFCPTVPAAYTCIVTGNFEPVPISAANPVTYLSTVYPALLQAACMIFLTGALLRNYGAQSDDPKSATSWEGIYKGLMTTAVLEEQRRRLQGVGWSQFMPTPIANPMRP